MTARLVRCSLSITYGVVTALYVVDTYAKAPSSLHRRLPPELVERSAATAGVPAAFREAFELPGETPSANMRMAAASAFQFGAAVVLNFEGNGPHARIQSILRSGYEC